MNKLLLVISLAAICLGFAVWIAWFESINPQSNFAIEPKNEKEVKPIVYLLSPSDRVVGNFIGDKAVFDGRSKYEYYDENGKCITCNVTKKVNDTGVDWVLVTANYTGKATVTLTLDSQGRQIEPFLNITNIRIGETREQSVIKNEYNYSDWKAVSPLEYRYTNICNKAGNGMGINSCLFVTFRNMTIEKNKTYGIHIDAIRNHVSLPYYNASIELFVTPENHPMREISDTVDVLSWQSKFGTKIPLTTLIGVSPNGYHAEDEWAWKHFPDMLHHEGFVVMGKWPQFHGHNYTGILTTYAQNWYGKKLDILNSYDDYQKVSKIVEQQWIIESEAERTKQITKYVDNFGMPQDIAAKRYDDSGFLGYHFTTYYNHTGTNQTCMAYWQDLYTETFKCDNIPHIHETKSSSIVILEFAKQYIDEGLKRIDQLESQGYHSVGPMNDITVTIWTGNATGLRAELEKQI